MNHRTHPLSRARDRDAVSEARSRVRQLRDSCNEMRFRATVENIPIFFREFTASQACFLLSLVGPGIIQAIEKLQKKCIIKFTEDEMHIICNDDANEGGIQVWS